MVLKKLEKIFLMCYVIELKFCILFDLMLRSCLLFRIDSLICSSISKQVNQCCVFADEDCCNVYTKNIKLLFFLAFFSLLKILIYNCYSVHNLVVECD